MALYQKTYVAIRRFFVHIVIFLFRIESNNLKRF